MLTPSVQLYDLRWQQTRTYTLAALFVIANVVVPQLCHLMPQGGLIWLPIYFFTLVGAYKYGLRVGLLTAILSPLVNCALTGMPALAALPVIIAKGVVLASLAAWVAQRTGKVTLLALVGVVLGYQLAGSAVEWLITGSLQAALQDITLGYPGMIVQAVGGYLLLRFVLKK